MDTRLTDSYEVKEQQAADARKALDLPPPPQAVALCRLVERFAGRGFPPLLAAPTNEKAAQIVAMKLLAERERLLAVIADASGALLELASAIARAHQEQSDALAGLTAALTRASLAQKEE